ncbi:MAG: hypothetical protein WDN44_15190 [Sphingomonas sp.]
MIAGSPPWRPISLTPDRTWNSLIALLTPLCVLVAYAGLRDDQRKAILPVLIGLAFLSALLGIAQISGGGNLRPVLL